VGVSDWTGEWVVDTINRESGEWVYYPLRTGPSAFLISRLKKK